MRKLKLEGKYNEAIQVGQEVFKAHRDPNVLFLLAECLAELNQFSTAISVLKESAKAEKCGRSNNLLGKIYMKQGEQEDGIAHLKRASEQCVLNLDRKVDLAQAYFDSGKQSEAEAIVDEILKSCPTNLILTDLGNLYLNHGDLEKAGSYLKNGAIPTPDTVHVFNTYAIGLRRRGLFEESEDIYKRCISLIPDSFALYFNLGMLYNQIGRHIEAIVTFKQALELNPGYEPAEILLKATRERIQADQSKAPVA